MLLFSSRICLIVSVIAAGALQATPTKAGDGCFVESRPYECVPAGDIDPATLRNYVDLYKAYAEMAWQDFVALNWPAATGSDGQPIPVPSSENGLNYNGGSYTTVWETYIEARDLYPSDGSVPRNFLSEHTLPETCKNLGGDGRIMLDRIAKSGTSGSPTHDVLGEFIQANRTGPVVDVEGNYLRFGINFNQNMHDYVLQNGLYNAPGQEAFDSNNLNRNSNPVEWPRGTYSAIESAANVGSIMSKSSWRILTKNDDKSQFHTVSAYIYNQPVVAFGKNPSVPGNCTVETVGLIGFHIAHRSNSSPQWVWSTFEHVANAPWIYDFKKGTPTGHFSLFDPSICPAVNGAPSCEYNKPPDHPWNSSSGNSESSQVIRIGAPGKYAALANKQWHEKILNVFGNSAWANYFMVDVQFPTNVIVTDVSTGLAKVNPAYPSGLPTPTFLANSALETYIQGYPDLDSDILTSNGNSISLRDQMQNVDAVAEGSMVNPFNGDVTNVSGGVSRNTSSCISCHGDASLVTGTSGSFVFSLSRAATPPQKLGASE